MTHESLSPENSAVEDAWIGPDGRIDADELAATLEGFRARLRRIVGLRLDPRVRARVDASDIVQEAYLEATQRAAGYVRDREVPFFLWVRFLAVQRVAHEHRKHLGAQMRDARREVRSLGPQASSIAMAEVLAASTPTPSQQYATEERKRIVMETLDTLAEADREVLALRHVEGLSNRECAHVLELTDAGASRRYLRAAKRFALALRQRGLGDTEFGRE